MDQHANSVASRRNFIRLSAGAVALIPVVNLLGCSDGGSGSAGAPAETGGEQPSPSMAPGQSEAPGDDTSATRQTGSSEPAAAQSTPAAQAGGADLVKLEESDPTAKALGYRHAAAEVDAKQYPRHQEGQLCSNCNLYQPGASDEAQWGGCSIFPGKLVNADGWCSAYVGQA